MAERLEILPIEGMGDIRPGTDLAEAIVAAAPWLRDGDVLVVTSKIVSKAEGRLVDVPTGGAEREAARERILTAETARPVATRGRTRIVQTHHGFVMASAGIDASNVEPSRLVLLPKDPDASARGLRDAFRERFDLDVAVIVSDTMGRPWRNGLTDVALGAAGISPVRDHRGENDPYGNELHITQMAIIDELSSAAELVKGKCDGVPVAVIRGYHTDAEDGPGAVALVRDSQSDLFALGTAEARALGLREAAGLSDQVEFAEGSVAEDLVARAIGSLRAASTFFVTDPPAGSPPNTAHVVACQTSGDTPEELIALGADVHRLRCALAASGLGTALLRDPRQLQRTGATLLVAVGKRPGPGGLK